MASSSFSKLRVRASSTSFTLIANISAISLTLPGETGPLASISLLLRLLGKRHLRISARGNATRHNRFVRLFGPSSLCSYVILCLADLLPCRKASIGASAAVLFEECNQVNNSRRNELHVPDWRERQRPFVMRRDWEGVNIWIAW